MSNDKEKEDKLKEIRENLERDAKEALDSQEEVQEFLDIMEGSIEDIYNSLGRVEKQTNEMVKEIERMYMVYDASIINDYGDIKEIQKSGYGKVYWNVLDILLYRLLRSKDYMVYAYGQPVGFLHVRQEGKGSLHILNIVFKKEYQGQGLGKETIRYVKRLAKEWGKNKVTLRVRDTNKQAKGLYNKEGFFEKGIDKGYYKDTGEDAIKMEYIITGDE